jgi:lysophospholipid acyltransferase (LPLAT)-like uncharacterized protein
MPETQIPTPGSPPQKLTRRAMRSGIVVPHSPKWHQRLVAWVVWGIVGLIGRTVRYRVHDPTQLLQRKDLKQVIYCLWHNRIVLCVKIYFKFARRQSDAPGLAALVSASKDGALLSAIFRRFGVQPVRGSSSRRGAQALMEMTTWAQRGYDLAITPDGPRGPRYVMAEGVIALAQVTGVPLVTAGYDLSRKITLKSWDHLQIPLPFTRCDVRIGRAFQVPRELTDEAREQLRREIEADLRILSHD